ncbi:MAG: hypothetical protein RMJ66_01230 [Bacteroidia bacterium]|nr:hypothetical protein [Bacteroidia bacterium]MDW8133666.1 hypothetical protein [Bacteroidia bacterium]
MIRNILFISLLLGVEACGIFRDPRANCNHPKHEEYIREQQASRIAKQTRQNKKTAKAPRPQQKSCPNP